MDWIIGLQKTNYNSRYSVLSIIGVLQFDRDPYLVITVLLVQIVASTQMQRLDCKVIFLSMLGCVACQAYIRCKRIQLIPNIHSDLFIFNSYSSCTIHFIRDSVLKELVLDTIRKVAKYVQKFEPMFLYLFAKQNTLGREINFRNMKQTFEKSKHRI